MMLELAEGIGVNTNLEYDDSGMMKIDFEVLNEIFWNDERPAFVKEQKKIFMFTLLSLSSPSRESAELFATSMYLQEDSKLNEPVLKVMCHGPDFDSYAWPNEINEYDISKDESKFKHSFPKIKHNQCESFKKVITGHISMGRMTFVMI